MDQIVLNGSVLMKSILTIFTKLSNKVRNSNNLENSINI